MWGKDCLMRPFASFVTSLTPPMSIPTYSSLTPRGWRGYGAGERVQFRLAGDPVLDGCGAAMGLDPDILVCVSWAE